MTEAAPRPSVAGAPVGSPHRFPLLDGLRAIAALMVVGYHAHSPGLQLDAPAAGQSLWDGGQQLNMGVTVFFVLSGFLLYRPFAAARLAGTRAPDVPGYLVRRGLRVLPGYWVAITVFGLLLPQLVPVLVQDWWIFYGLVQTWVPGRMFDGLSPAWSLSVEMSFYLALPVYALVAKRVLGRLPVRQQVRLEFGLLAAAVVGTYLARRFVFDRGDGPLGFLVWSVLGHVDWFAGGLALALASILWGRAEARPRWVELVERHPNRCWVAAVALFLALGFVHGSPGDVVHVASLAAAVLLVAPAVFGGERTDPVRRALGSRPMQWLGLVSFGIFLWNEPLASFFHHLGWDDWGLGDSGYLLFLVTAAAAIVLGALSYYLVERPTMALGRRRSAPRVPRQVGGGEGRHRARPGAAPWSVDDISSRGGVR
ncbi:acyltransferase family protein [Pseudonocardia sp. CA-107938]|uniref:acyltransferase family protein n=1 Tax=Pseudonocardia sp. CA-107938 TaxID=3240021 RepID=UPI003D905C36